MTTYPLFGRDLFQGVPRAIRASQLAAQDIPIPEYVNGHLRAVIAKCITAEEDDNLFQALMWQHDHDLAADLHTQRMDAEAELAYNVLVEEPTMINLLEDATVNNPSARIGDGGARNRTHVASWLALKAKHAHHTDAPLNALARNPNVVACVEDSHVEFSVNFWLWMHRNDAGMRPLVFTDKAHNQYLRYTDFSRQTSNPWSAQAVEALRHQASQGEARAYALLQPQGQGERSVLYNLVFAPYAIRFCDRAEISRDPARENTPAVVEQVFKSFV